jgi:class 3 adenylate cyclase
MTADPSCFLRPANDHIPPPFPPDEGARLRALHSMKILDTAEEDRFDRLVHLTSTLFGAPIAYLAMVDGHRQWFKARIGITPTETPRNVSFCGHAILQDEALVVNDARRDIRFANLPLVIEEPYVRFYAGQPLRGPGGHKIGTLCMLDTRPRKLEPRDLDVLKKLGELVEHEFEMRNMIELQKEAIQAKEALAESEAKLAKTVEELQLAQHRSEELLRNVLPEGLVCELRDHGQVAPVRHEEVAVLFADFAGFTKVAADCCPRELVDELNECFCHFDWVMAKHGVEKLKTIGDGYLAVSGMPMARPDDAARMVRAAFELRDFMAERKAEHEQRGERCWDVRIGLHLGPLVAGVVGVRKLAYDVWGDTVNTASRIESAGTPGRINASAVFHDRVRDLVVSEHRGLIGCKNKGEVEMYFIDALK